MSRIVLNNEQTEEENIVCDNDLLDTLITRYAKNKTELDSYKKLCEADNKEIKSHLERIGETEHSANGYTAKRIVVEKESLNEDRLLEVLKKHAVQGIIKTKEYVDMDALESYMYNTEIPEELAVDLSSCRTVTQVVQLRISKAKKKAE